MNTRDLWIGRGGVVPIEHEIDRRGIKLRGRTDHVDPCSVCGDADRFGVNTSKQVFNCRGCGRGGDVIALLQLTEGCDVPTAVETVIGERRLNGNGGQQLDPESARKEQEQPAEQRRQDTAHQRDKARWLWRNSEPATGTIVEAHLRERGRIAVPPPAIVRFLPASSEPDRHPAMITACGIACEPEPGVLTIGEVVITAVHLTLLKPDGSYLPVEVVRKALMRDSQGRPDCPLGCALEILADVP
jgi:hypothetical protein